MKRSNFSSDDAITYEGLLDSSKKVKTLKCEDADQFPHAWIGDSEERDYDPRPLLEYQLNEIAGMIREKPNWISKMKDPAIWQKWSMGLTEPMMKYVKEELEWYAANQPGPYIKSGVDSVYFADGIVNADVLKELVAQVKVLEDVPDEKKDWHPGSDEQVLDLVHPSLYCLVFGVTKGIKEQIRPSLASIGQGQTPDAPDASSSYSISKKYQWLPSEFVVSHDGKVKIDSYINNLHPIKHKSLYLTIQKVFQEFVPLFNQVLTNLLNPAPPVIEVDPYDWYVDDHYEDEDYGNRKMKPIEIPTFTPPSDPITKVDIRGRTLQVIVKLATIVLTPESPEYIGGSWHIEGMQNENIVASGIYYYQNENISDSYLDFRVATNEPRYEQSDDQGMSEVYGLVNEGALSQRLGSVKTKEGRLLAFPNVYQHQVQPFQLEDQSKNGYRKILVFFLVNPYKRIVSTANVPPQQADWYWEVLRRKSPFAEMPKDVLDLIGEYVSWPMSLEEAKEYRKGLMKERKFFTAQNTDVVFERPFSLCEH